MDQPVGRYRILRRLAAGAMGEVYLVAQTGPEGFSRLVALKRMLPTVTSEHELVRHFLDEARLVATLSHRNIAQILDFGRDDAGYFVAMEFVQGPSVYALLDRLQSRGQRMAPALAVDIAAQVADALGYASAARGPDGSPLNIVHRDVSPHNILVSLSGDVKLIDFGVAKSAQQRHATQAGIIKGKLGYMSPEQSRGEPVDGRSDLFSLGIVLCEMLSGQNPFGRSDLVQTVVNIQTGEPRLPSADDPSLAVCDPVLRRLLAKPPSERYANGAELFEELSTLRGSLPRPPARLGPLVSEFFGEQFAELARSLGDANAPQSIPANAGASGDLPVEARTPQTVRFGASEIAAGADPITPSGPDAGTPAPAAVPLPAVAPPPSGPDTPSAPDMEVQLPPTIVRRTGEFLPTTRPRPRAARWGAVGLVVGLVVAGVAVVGYVVVQRPGLNRPRSPADPSPAVPVTIPAETVAPPAGAAPAAVPPVSASPPPEQVPASASTPSPAPDTPGKSLSGPAMPAASPVKPPPKLLAADRASVPKRRAKPVEVGPQADAAPGAKATEKPQPAEKSERGARPASPLAVLVIKTSPTASQRVPLTRFSGRVGLDRMGDPVVTIDYAVVEGRVLAKLLAQPPTTVVVGGTDKGRTPVQLPILGEEPVTIDLKPDEGAAFSIAVSVE